MIKYNTKTINDWNFDSSNIVKVYHNGAVCYYKLEGSPTPTGQTPCYAVVDDITQYSATEFVDVFDKATQKWYKLNNLNEYEEYGLYGEGLDITYYEGKLTIDNGYEYERSGGGWVNRGEVVGSSTIIKSPEYIERTSAYNGYCSLLEYLTQDTKIIIKHRQTNGGGGRIIGDSVITDSDDWRFFFVGSTLYYDFITQRTSASKSMPMSAAEEWEVGNYYIKDTSSGKYLINRSTQTFSSRPDHLYIYHSSGESHGESGTDYGQIWYVKIYKNNVLVRDFIPWTDMNGNYGLYDKVNNVTVQATGQMTGSTTVNDVEIGSFEYPLHYEEKQDPPKELVFNTMEEALAYQCPYEGVLATIGGTLYVFNSDYEWQRVNFNITGVTTSSSVFDIQLNMQKESVVIYKDNGDGTYNWGLYYPNAINDATNMCSGNTAMTSFDWDAADTSSLTGLSYSFKDCSGLTSMPSIPANVTEIGDYTFYNCQNMNNGGTIEIPEGVQRIGREAFNIVFHINSKNLKLPSTLNYVGRASFLNINHLSDLYITDLSSFYKIEFYDSNSSVFNGSRTHLYVNNSQVTDLTIPSDITTLTAYTFYNAKTITGVTIPSTVTSIGGSGTFENSGLRNVTVPSSVTSWNGGFTFAYSDLTDATLNNSGSVGRAAFYSCTSLTSVTFGNNITAIDSYAFYVCKSLTGVTFGDNITAIGDNAFSGCTKLSSITFESTTPPTIDISSFGGVKDTCKFYVPCSAVNTYRTASVWSSYASQIVAYESCTIYDWEVVPNEYICYRNDKYEQMKKIRSFDGGTTWEDVYPIEYQRGQLIEASSTDCASSIAVNLNSQWQTSTSYGSISDTGNYDFYESASNYHVNNGKATMFITINGYTSFTFKVRNSSEYYYDYVVVNNLDDTTIPKWQPTVGSGTASSGKVYYSNKSASSTSTWHDVTFSNLDGGEHTITVTYGKDGSANVNDDRGYVAIPITQ